jgi:DNA-binding FrmR family transcriptional regulator
MKTSIFSIVLASSVALFAAGGASAGADCDAIASALAKVKKTQADLIAKLAKCNTEDCVAATKKDMENAAKEEDKLMKEFDKGCL